MQFHFDVYGIYKPEKQNKTKGIMKQKKFENIDGSGDSDVPEA